MGYSLVGTTDGEQVGFRLLGLQLGWWDGMTVDGYLVGRTEGLLVGMVDGFAVGFMVGANEGLFVGK